MADSKQMMLTADNVAAWKYRYDLLALEKGNAFQILSGNCEFPYTGDHKDVKYYTSSNNSLLAEILKSISKEDQTKVKKLIIEK